MSVSSAALSRSAAWRQDRDSINLEEAFVNQALIKKWPQDEPPAAARQRLPATFGKDCRMATAAGQELLILLWYFLPHLRELWQNAEKMVRIYIKLRNPAAGWS
ncbi:MAG: hypothetical protein LBQ15_13635 [Clostridium sp.]|jgi:hypothetical protein|nr:hypothetical protein [Clostridium sp.]